MPTVLQPRGCHTLPTPPLVKPRSSKSSCQGIWPNYLGSMATLDSWEDLKPEGLGEGYKNSTTVSAPAQHIVL